MGFGKNGITATEIEAALKAWLRSPSGNATISAASAGYGASEYLRNISKDLVALIFQYANDYSTSRGWAPLIKTGLLEWGNHLGTGKVRVGTSGAAPGKTIVSVWLPVADDLLGKESWNPKRRGYKRGVYDVIGLMTRGYSRDDRVVQPPVLDTSTYWPGKPHTGWNRVSWHRTTRTVHYIQRPHIWGFEQSSFVQEAINEFEMRYASLGAKVVGLPDSWK